MSSQQQESFELVKQKAPSMTQDELMKIGDDFAANYEYQKAIDIYTIAIEKDVLCDEAAPIFSNRSLCYFTIGKYKEACDDAEKCCSIRPDWANGFLRRATAAQRLEEWQIALDSYDEYLKLDPTDEARVKNNRKLAAKSFQRHKEVAELKRQQQAKQEEREKNDKLAKMNDKQQQDAVKEEGFTHLPNFDGSIESLITPAMRESFDLGARRHHQAKAASMTQTEVKNLGDEYVAHRNYHKAIEFYTLAIEKDAFCDEAAAILANRSLCYFTVGKYKEAYEDGGCCCGIRPDWATGFARRGAAAEKLDESEIALESYEQYLKLDPSDKMGIKSKKAQVENDVRNLKKQREKREAYLCNFEARLAQTKQQNRRKVIVQKLFGEGCYEMDIEKIELAVFFGADFAEKHDNNAFKDTMTGANCALMPLHKLFNCGDRLTEFETTKLHIKQRNYLDRLLDIPAKQQQKYVAPSKDVAWMITQMCAYDCHSPIRDDLVAILLEKGKTFFFGDIVPDKEFRKILLRCLLLGGAYLESDCDIHIPGMGKPDPFAANMVRRTVTGSSLRKLLECLEMCIHGLSAKDINSECEIVGNFFDSSRMRLLPLYLAAFFHAPPDEVTQLLLDRGVELDGGTLGRALSVGAPAVSALMLSRGAKLPCEKVPEILHSYFSPKDAETMLVPEQYETDKLSRMFWKFRSFNSIRADEERIRLAFDAMSAQNLSFIMKNSSDNSAFATPLTLMMTADLSPPMIHLIKICIKVRPKLLFTPAIAYGAKFFPFGWLVEKLAFGWLMTAEIGKHIAKVFIEHGLDYYKSVAYQSLDPNEASLSAEALLNRYLKDEKVENSGKACLAAVKQFCVDATRNQKLLNC